MDFTPTRNRNRKSALVDLTPLIDVTFQLLIFFLLTSSYVSPIQQTRTSVEIELPEVGGERKAGKFDGFRIAVSSQGKIFLDDGLETSLQELEIRLNELKRKNANTIVLISGDKKASYGRVAPILELVQFVGLPASVDFELPDSESSSK